MQCNMIISWHLEKLVLHAWDIVHPHCCIEGTQGEVRQGLFSRMPGVGGDRYESPA